VNYATFFDSAFDVNSAITSYNAASNVAISEPHSNPATRRPVGQLELRSRATCSWG
jgi:hypothetical protein